MSQESAPPIDPMAFWKPFYEANMEVWSQSMAYLVESAPFSQAMSSYLDTYLTSSASLQKIVDYYMGMWLANVNMPSREDLSRLERQLINAEPGDLSSLSRLSGKVDQMTQQIATLEATIQRLERQIATCNKPSKPARKHHTIPTRHNPNHPPGIDTRERYQGTIPGNDTRERYQGTIPGIPERNIMGQHRVSASGLTGAVFSFQRCANIGDGEVSVG